MPRRNVEENHRNSLYLVAALCMIFITMMIAVQPLYLRHAFGLARDNAGFVNANIQVMTEIVDMLSVAYLGYLSDRYGRIPVIVFGFLLAALTAVLAPFSLEMGVWLGVNGLILYYLFRMIMSLGTAGVWPQVATLTGDFSNKKNRPRLMANAGFMLAFGATLSYAVLMQIPQYSGMAIFMLMGAVVALVGAWVAKSFLIDVAEKLPGESVPFGRIKDLLKKDKRLRLTFLAAFTSRNDMVIIGLFLMIWFIYFADLVNIPYAEAAAHAGIVIGFIGVTVLLSIPVWGSVIDKYGRVTTIAMGLGLSGVGFISFGLVTDPFGWWILVPAFLAALGQAGCLLAPQTLTIDLAPKDIRGSVLGAFNTAGCVGIVLFVQAGGFLFDRAGPPAPFVFTGIANLLIMGYAILVIKSDKKPLEEAYTDTARPPGSLQGLDVAEEMTAY